MAVYQGARRRAPMPIDLGALGRWRGRSGETRRTPRATTHANRAARRAGRSVAARRPSSVGLTLVAIVMVFGAAFLSLSQSVRVAATGYDIVRLVSEHERLAAISQDLRSDVDRLRSEYAIRKQALDAGLGQLGAPLIVEAR
jgi:hypothetical protein